MSYTISEGTATAWAVTTITARTIITDAMREMNAIGQGETISTNDANLGLVKLNRLMDQWWASKQYVPYRQIVSYAWSTSKSSYTIGPSGDFVGDRPVRVEKANLIRTWTDPDQHIPINVYDADEFFRLAYPALDAEEPESIYYQATVTNGTIYPYPYPSDTTTALANKLELLVWTQLSKFTTLDTAISLAPGYEEAIILTLAERLCPSFEKESSLGLRREAAKAREILTSINVIPFKPDGRDYGIPDCEGWG